MEVKYRAGESVFTVQGLNLSSIDSAPTGKCSSVGRIEGVGIQNSLFLVWWPRSLELDTSFPWVQRREWHPTPVLLSGKPHGQRSLVGCSPGTREESDKTERPHFHFSLSCVGEGNGNPFHCSFLENPRDGEVWWAAIYGVAQSGTRVK